MREAEEECAIDSTEVVVHGVLRDDHGGWTYRTVLASAPAPLAAYAASEETRTVAWVPADRCGLAQAASGICRTMGGVADRALAADDHR